LRAELIYKMQGYAPKGRGDLDDARSRAECRVNSLLLQKTLRHPQASLSRSGSRQADAQYRRLSAHAQQTAGNTKRLEA
jgi:hypothetical protein